MEEKQFDENSALRKMLVYWYNETGSLDKAIKIMSDIVDQDKKAALVEIKKGLEKEIREENESSEISIISNEEVKIMLFDSKSYVFWNNLMSNWAKDNFLDESAINAVDESTTQILARLLSPEGSKKKHGLVIGYVQSGKTANYSGLIAKAADNGFTIFIVLTGISEKLRRQTQARLDKHVIGEMTNDWIRLTDTERDFQRQTTSLGSLLLDSKDSKEKKPILIVIKKNHVRLTNLLNWIKNSRSEIRGLKVLVIDDEADQASINISKDDEKSKINSRINEIIKIFSNVSYVAYTATPFANVLIDPADNNDLYPKDFIIGLPKPEKYFGTERIFGKREYEYDGETITEQVGLDVIRLVPEDEVDFFKPPSNSKADSFILAITGSLEEAIDYFWIACAWKRKRGIMGSSSMLIHPSSSIRVHEKYQDRLNAYRKNLLNNLSNDLGWENLEAFWTNERMRVTTEDTPDEDITFQDIRDIMESVIKNTEIIIENYSIKKEDRLPEQYDKDKDYIVIGGNVLSRGITLPGLIVSFFIRSTTTYDALLQMGRWFGYKTGYSDICRIWMTEELQSSFYDLSIVEEEIRLELNNYEIRKAGPEKFGIRIRTHPYLEITSKLKMGKAIRLWVSYEDKRIQTTRFKRTDKEWLEHNIMVSDKLISKLNERNYNREIYPDQKIWRDVDVSNVISFLQDFNVHEKSHFNKKNVIDYIKKQNERNILISWNVVIRSRKEGELGQISLGGIECNLINRIRSGNKNNKFDVDNPDALIRGLSTVRDEYADLTEKIINQPLSRDENENIRIRDELFKNKGLLVLYPISMNSQPILDPHNKLSLDAEENIIGFSIKFPKIEKDKPVSYMTVDLSDIDREELTNEEYQMIIVD